jgi:hypothetical protein
MMHANYNMMSYYVGYMCGVAFKKPSNNSKNLIAAEFFELYWINALVTTEDINV